MLGVLNMLGLHEQLHGRSYGVHSAWKATANMMERRFTAKPVRCALILKRLGPCRTRPTNYNDTLFSFFYPF